MIVGLGTDIVKISRIEKIVKIYEDKFLSRILSREEQVKIDSVNESQRIKYLAKRFAAKEAFVKAIGSGFNGLISFKDISVLNDKMGKPYYNINTKINKYIKEQLDTDHYSIHISISDDSDYANAVAIIEKFD